MWRDALWRQFGAAIDRLDEAVRVCPDKLLPPRSGRILSMPGFSAFGYLASDEQLKRPCRVGGGQLPIGEPLLYGMRLVREQAVQLNMFLGRRTGLATGWVRVAWD